MTRTLLPIALVSILVRVLFLAQVGEDPRFDQPISDLAVYHNWAIDWSNGEPYAQEPPGRPFWRSPGYAVFLTPLYSLFGEDQVATPRKVAALQMLLGVLATLAVCAFAFRRWGATAAWITALSIDLHAPSIFMEAVLLPVGLATPLLTFTGLLLLKLLEKEEGRFRRLALGAGLLAGLNAVLRPNLGLVLPLAAGLIWRRRGLRRNTGWFLGAAVLPLLATTAWNLERSGQFAVTGTNGPMNLFFAYGPDTGPTFDVHDHRWGNPELQAKIAREYAVVKEAIRKKLPPNTPLQPLTNKEASRYWAGEALTWMEAHPEMVLQRILEKFLGVLTWRDLAVILPIDASRGAILILYLLLVPFPLILLLGLFGARRRGGIVSSAVWIGFVPILLGALLFFTYTRFRVPAVPLLALAAGPGFLELRKVRWSGIKIAALVLFAAAFTAATWNPWLGKEARAKHYDKTSVAHGWWQVGIGWYQRYQDALHAGHPQGRMIERSLAALRRSKELQPESPLPDHWIGLITRDNLHDGPRAYSIFRQLVRKYPVTSFPDASAELGVCEVLGLGEGGVPDYARADQLFRQVERNNGMKTVYLPHWAKALKELGRDQEACQKLKEVLQSRILTPRERTRFEKMSRDWGCG